MEGLIRRHKVLVCAGSGGVGKTTISAALGLVAAELGLRVLVLTIDPARRLASALGLEGQLHQEVEIPAVAAQGRMFVAMIDQAKIFDEFVRRVADRPETAERLIANRLYQQLSTTLSGSQEFTSLERLLQAYESGQYDLIVLDTPPAQHAIEFLHAPERIFNLFQESVTRWFIQSPEQRGFLQQLLHRGTQTVLSALERLTGNQFIRELSDFFTQMAKLQATVSARSLEVSRLLTGTQTGFVLITGFDEAKLKEALLFANDLRGQNYHLVALIINRFFPEKFPDSAWSITPTGDSQLAKLKEFYSELKIYYAQRLSFCAEIEARLGEGVKQLRIPEFKDSVVGIENLQLLAKKLRGA